MPAPITTELVWREVEKRFFAVLGMVTAKGEARTVGIVYVAKARRVYIGTYKDAWKTRHIRQNPSVSLTVIFPKRIPFLPWIPIPAATITFQGRASIQEIGEVDPDVVRELTRGMEVDEKLAAQFCIIRVEPKGHFLTYGVGVSLLTMRKPQEARGRVAVG